MTKKRFIVVDGDYDIKYEFRIADLNRVKKTKEDFWDSEEECYNTHDFLEYLLNNNAFITAKDADLLLNNIAEDNEKLHTNLLEKEKIDDMEKKMINQGIIFNLDEYPDINIDDFEKHLFKYFNKYYTKLLYDKYIISFKFYHNHQENTIRITADIEEINYETDNHLDEIIKEMMDKRRELEIIEKSVINACDKYDKLITDTVLEINGILEAELSDEMTIDKSKLKEFIKQGIVKSIKE